MTPPNFRKYVYTAAIAALATACGSEADMPSVHSVQPHTDALAALNVGSADQWLSESMSKRRFIGVKRTGYLNLETGAQTPCPVPNGPYEVRPLFRPNDSNQSPSWAMGNFCLYEAAYDQQVTIDSQGNLNLPDDLEALLCGDGNNNGSIGVTNTNPVVLTNCLKSIGPDRFAVGSHGSANPKGQLATVMAPLFEEEFLSHAGYVADFPASQYESKTRLAFLDTSRTENTQGVWPSFRYSLEQQAWSRGFGFGRPTEIFK